MVARHIPTLMAIGAVLAAYRLLGVGDVFKELIKKELQPAYDVVIGIGRRHRKQWRSGRGKGEAVGHLPPPLKIHCLSENCRKIIFLSKKIASKFSTI